MELSPVTARLLVSASGLLEELSLRPGAEVVARVLALPPGAAGAALISLAGHAVFAKLPPGMLEGQKLPLVVVGVTESGEIVLRVRKEGGDHRELSQAALARLAGALAAAGDGELVRVALSLAPGSEAIALPSGEPARIRIEEEEPGGGEEERRGGGAEAAVVLHSARLGPIELRLRLEPGVVRATVAVEQGEAYARAKERCHELLGALERATQRPAAVTVAARAAGERRPARAPVEVFDGYA